MKLEEEIEKYIPEKDNPNSAQKFETLLQKQEESLRQHISVEHQLKIQCEKFAEKFDILESQKMLLINEIVSKNIFRFIYIQEQQKKRYNETLEEINKQIDSFVKDRDAMEKEYKTQLINKDSLIVQLQTKIDILTGGKKSLPNPEIKRVFISNSSKEKQNINYNNYDFYTKQYMKKDKNQTLDYLSQLAKNKTINILNNNISIKTIKNYHPNSLSINNNMNENKIPFYKFQYKYDNNIKPSLEKNNSAPNIHLHNIDVKTNNVRKKFFLNNNTKKNKNKNTKISVKETGIKYLLKDNKDKNTLAEKENALYSKSNYKKIIMPYYIVNNNNNQNFEEKLKVNLNTNTINENLIEKIKQKNIEEYNRFVNLKLDGMENLNKMRSIRKKKVKSCESRKYISPYKKFQKKFNKIMSSTTIDRDRELRRNNSTFNLIFKNINNEKGDKSNYLKNMILYKKENESNNNNKIIYNFHLDKANNNNSRKINLNTIGRKMYVENYSKITSKKTN